MHQRAHIVYFGCSRAFTAAVAACCLTACHSGAEPEAPVAPAIKVFPDAVEIGAPGTRVGAMVQVQGIGATPTITWTSLAPDVVAVDSVQDGGYRVVLRSVQARPAYVVVTAQGTRVLVDTLPVTIRALVTSSQRSMSGNLTPLESLGARGRVRAGDGVGRPRGG